MNWELIGKICLVLLGVALAVGIFCVAVAIGCAVNGISFGAQIAQWFGQSATTVGQPVEEVIATIAHTPII